MLCYHDIYDSVLEEQQDDKLALIFETNKNMRTPRGVPTYP